HTDTHTYTHSLPSLTQPGEAPCGREERSGAWGPFQVTWMTGAVLRPSAWWSTPPSPEHRERERERTRENERERGRRRNKEGERERKRERAGNEVMRSRCVCVCVCVRVNECVGAREAKARGGYRGIPEIPAAITSAQEEHSPLTVE